MSKSIYVFVFSSLIAATVGCGISLDLPTAGCGNDCEDSSDCVGDLICDETGVCAEVEGGCTEENTGDCLKACNTSDDCSSNYICNSNGLCALDDSDTCSE